MIYYILYYLKLKSIICTDSLSPDPDPVVIITDLDLTSYSVTCPDPTKSCGRDQQHLKCTSNKNRAYGRITLLRNSKQPGGGGGEEGRPAAPPRKRGKTSAARAAAALSPPQQLKGPSHTTNICCEINHTQVPFSPFRQALNE